MHLFDSFVARENCLQNLEVVEEWRGSGSSAQELEVGPIEETGTSRVINANCSYYIGH